MNITQLWKRGLIVLLLIATVSLINTIIPAMAYPFITQPFNVTQPDGTNIQIQEIGDEFAKGNVTVDGHYSVVKQDDGYWHYVDINGKKTSIVGVDTPMSNNYKGVYLSPEDAKKAKEKRYEVTRYLLGTTDSDPEYLNKIISSTGTVSFPVILIRFSDVPASQYDNITIEQHLFGSHPSTETGPGSVYDYYQEVSYDELTVTGDVYGWKNLANDTTYYTSSEHYLDIVRDAVQSADSDIDFSQYDSNDDGYVDNVIIIMCGKVNGWRSGCDSFKDVYIETGDSYHGLRPMRIWSFFICPEIENSSQTNTLLQCGVYAHEIAHVLSLPDIYDDDPDPYDGGEDNWDLMTNACYNGIITSSDCPAHLSAWEKACLGYINVDQITVGQHVEDILPIWHYPIAYQLLDNPNGFEGRNMGELHGAGEYFLLEYRSKTGFDQALPGEGLLIWHVNEYNTRTGNNDPSNKLLDLEQADGHAHSADATDPWYAPLHTTFNHDSIPNSDLNSGDPSGVSVTNICEVPEYPYLYDPMSATIWITLPGYTCVKEHDISGSQDGNLTDYQVQFVIHSGTGTDTDRDIYLNGSSQSWPYDFRFTNSDGNMLDYWIESYDASSATVWVKVDYIAVSPAITRLYINYGKQNDPGASDGNATFVVFDHFNGSSLDTNKWVQWGTGSNSVSNSNLRLSATGQNSMMAHYKNSIPLSSYVIETKGKVISPYYYQYNKYRPGVLFRQGSTQNSGAVGFDTYAFDGDGWTVFDWGSWSWYDLSSPASISPTDTYSGAFRLQVTVSGSSYTCREALRNKVITDSRGPTGSYFSLLAEKCTDDYDWVFVRKYTTHEPIQPMGMRGAPAIIENSQVNVTIDQSRNKTHSGNKTIITPDNNPVINGSDT